MPDFTLSPPPKPPLPPPAPPGCRKVDISSDQCSAIDDLCSAELSGSAVFGIFSATVISVVVLYILFTAVDGCCKGKSLRELPRHTADMTLGLCQRSIHAVRICPARLVALVNGNAHTGNEVPPDVEMDQSEPLRHKV